MDVDSDGLNDVVLVEYNGLYIKRQLNSTDYAATARNYEFSNASLTRTILTDLNNDGILDVVGTDGSWSAEQTGRVLVQFGRPNGEFGDEAVIDLGHRGWARQLAGPHGIIIEVDGYGRGRSFIHYSNENQEFELRTLTPMTPSRMYRANTNGDSFPDVVAFESDNDREGARVALYESQPDGSWTYEVIQEWLPFEVYDASPVDVDGDGRDEFLLRERYSEPIRLLSELDGHWELVPLPLDVMWGDGSGGFGELPSVASSHEINVHITSTDATVQVSYRRSRHPSVIEYHLPVTNHVDYDALAATGETFLHDHAEVDVDRDGDLDVIVSHGSGIAVLLAVG